MDTKQKKPQAPRSGAKTGAKRTNKKKTGGLFGLVKPKSRPAAAPQRAVKRTPQEQAERRRRAEDLALAREAAEREQAAEAAALLTEEEGLPEMVFNTAEEHTRIRTPEENKRAAMRRKSAKRAKERQEEAKRVSKRPNVTYTQPAPFNLQKLLLQLTATVAVVLAVVMGLSVFFKVEKVVVYGNKAYSAWRIQEAAEIELDSNLLTFGATRACGRITTKLPYVDTARIGIKLPDTVNIYIKEFDVVYAIKSAADDWWLMTSGGKIVEQIDSGLANTYTRVLGVEVDSPVPGMQAKAMENLIPVDQATSPTASTEETEPVVIITGAERLRTALLILDALELNDIVGEASSIDVSSLNSLELMYGSRYQVKLGTSDNMEYKIASMKQAVAQLNEYQTGILDVSFTTWTDRPGYTPFE